MATYGTMSRDETVSYLSQHDVSQKLQSALNEAIKAKADDPVAFIADKLGGGAGAAPAAAPGLLPRPRSAIGKFLRVLSVNDVYKLDHYPRVGAAVRLARAEAEALGCVVTSHLNGDFLSPCTLTAIDGGRGMTEGLNHAQLDYVCLGNHEFDFGIDVITVRMKQFKGKCINSNVSDAKLAHLPAYDVVTVGERKVLVTGFLTGDTSIYAPSNTPTVAPPAEAAVAVWEKAKSELGYTPDLLLPMTHQLIHEDKAFCVALAKNEELERRTPIVLAGHEHDQFIDEAGKSTVVKVGQDAERIAVCDIWWDASGTMNSRVTVLPITEFEPEPTALAFVEEQQAFITKMMSSPIASTEAEMSSKKVRFEESGVASFLLAYVRRALKKDGVELAMVQGGFIRAKRDYKAGPFLMGDLFGEFAFEGPQAVIPLKGSIIQESTFNTRSAPKPAPNFLHFDSGVVVTPEHQIISVGGVPFDPEKIYTVAIYQFLLTGLNVIEPLMSYVNEHVKVPDTESCRPVKDVVLEVCMKDEWRRLIGFEGFDEDGDGQVTADELRAGLTKTMSKLDANGDGLISKEELTDYVHKMEGNVALVEQLIQSVDADGDGYVSLSELEALIY